MAESDLRNVSLVYHPAASITAEHASSQNTLWLQIKPKRWTLNTTSAKQTASDATGETTFMFMFPQEWSVGINHTWDAADTIGGKLRDVIAGAKSGTAQIQQGAGVLLPNDGFGGKVKETVKKATGAASTAVKNDNPITYKDTERRRFMFSLEFHTEGDNQNDVFAPVSELMRLSCAGGGSGGINDVSIDFPYVFSLKSMPGNVQELGSTPALVDEPIAAITSIQPTWKGPYYNGYPSHATVDIQFMALNPTYRYGFDSSRPITVSERVSQRRANESTERANRIDRDRGV